MKIFIIDKERRNLGNRPAERALDRRRSQAPSRRYLLIVSEPDVEQVLKREFAGKPNGIYPHESGDAYIFYCVADQTDEEQFIQAIFDRLQTSRLDRDQIRDLEVHICRMGDDQLHPMRYRLENDRVVQSPL